jgi:hypothetical protein
MFMIDIRSNRAVTAGILRALFAILVVFQNTHYAYLWTYRDPQLVRTVPNTALDLSQKLTEFVKGSVLDEACVSISIWSGVCS